jgi:predicted GNAT family acetyltransferase
VPTRPGLLDRVEGYFAAAPLPDARMLPAGGLDVPIGPRSWPYPARPRPGAGAVTPGDVRAALALQADAGLPGQLEWVAESAPDVAAAAAAAGLVVEELPLLVAADPVELLLPPEVRLYVVGADDPALPRYQQVAGIADGRPEEPAPVATLRERIAAGRTVLMVAVEHGEPVGVGSHHPVVVDGDEVSEVTGVATLPRLRGRGLGAGLASALVAHARESADLVFLTAGDDDVARVYERVGFARLGTTAVATPPDA